MTWREVTVTVAACAVGLAGLWVLSNAEQKTTTDEERRVVATRCLANERKPVPDRDFQEYCRVYFESDAPEQPGLGPMVP